MGVVIANPYDNDTRTWIKGNLHTHTSNSDGDRDPQAIIDDYAGRGYGFLMLSDHEFLTDPAPFDGRGMALIPGHEVSANGPHVLHVDADGYVEPDADRQVVIDSIARGRGFAICCHPNWQESFAHCPQSDLEAWTGYAGIEIYNGVIRRLAGYPGAADRWDRLLGLGRKVWGYAHDDSHKAGDVGLAWNVVQGDDRDPAAVAQALRDGRFYASTGVNIETVSVDDGTIRVETSNAERIVVYSDFGARQATVDAPTVTFDVPDDATCRYVRVQCWGPGEQMAWTQPFFIGASTSE